jgi:hypothetical protein
MVPVIDSMEKIHSLTPVVVPSSVPGFLVHEEDLLKREAFEEVEVDGWDEIVVKGQLELPQRAQMPPEAEEGITNRSL